jgi:hypothetical protein
MATDYNNPAFDYAYEIEKTVEVSLADGLTYRLEIVHRIKGYARKDYEVRYYTQHSVSGTATDIRSQVAAPSTGVDVWVRDMSLPSVDGMESAELALESALYWLADRYEHRNNPQ